MSNNTLDAKIGPLNVKQIMGLVLGFGIAFMLSILGWGWNSICFGFMIIGLALYMVPNMMGVRSIKILTAFGTASFIVIILIGSLVMSPGIVADNSGEPNDNGPFKNVTYTYDNSELTVTSDVVGYEGHDVIFYYATVEGVGYTGNQVMVKNNKEAIMTVTDNKATTTVTLDNSELYIGFLGVTETDDNGKEVPNLKKRTSSTFLTDAYDGSLTSIYFYGCFMASIASIIVFYLVLFMSSFMRKRFEVTRDKMEKEGRLYPQGYGRCDSCNSIVLPGEINCRKCGEYIDRPDSMKPQKKDFFECSECSAEVPSDAKECPKCGEVFDEEDEIIIQQANNDAIVVNEIYTCPECQSVIPDSSSFCAKCGRAKK